MDTETAKAIAQQLRKPEGEFALAVAEKMNEGNAVINRTTIDALVIEPNDQILEIGMGNGFFVPEILNIDSSIRYVGCDFSEEMVEASIKHNQQFVGEGRAQFFHCEAVKMPVSDRAIDKAFTVNTLYFWDNPEAVFAELKRVLKPGGLLAIAIRPKASMANYPFVKVGEFNLFNRKDVVELMSANGFEILEVLEKEEPKQVVGSEEIEVSSLVVIGRVK